MKKYRIEISEQANDDIENLSDVIMYKYNSYFTLMRFTILYKVCRLLPNRSNCKHALIFKSTDYLFTGLIVIKWQLYILYIMTLF